MRERHNSKKAVLKKVVEVEMSFLPQHKPKTGNLMAVINPSSHFLSYDVLENGQ